MNGYSIIRDECRSMCWKI